MKFDPNSVSFAEGAVKVERVLRKVGVKKDGKILTSVDDRARKAKDFLAVKNVPGDFRKWQIPVVLTQAQLFISEGKANAHVEEHSHDEGDGVRIIMSGSIVYDGKELKAGDWMYIPQGAKYSFRVGPNGASMCYCYCCCCGGREDIENWVPDPAPDLIG